MEKLYEWVRQIAYVMVLISVIMQLAAGKQYQKYIRLYTGIVLILFMLVPVFRIFGTDTTGFMTEAEKKYTEMVEQIETKSAELEEEDVEKSLEESEEEQTEAGRIEVGRFGLEDKKQIPKIDWKKLVGKCKDLCHRKDRLLIILLTGILLLVIAVPFSGEGDAETGLMHSGKTKDPSDNTSNEMAGNGNAETYADYLEQKLAKVLSEVHGVGQTEVMITMASSSEKILGADSESESESVKESDSQGGSRSTIQSRSSQTAIYDGGGSSQGAPYVTKELTPEVAGVIVIAEGGDDPVAVENIIEAVQALFEIDTHKIKVMKRN